MTASPPWKWTLTTLPCRVSRTESLASEGLWDDGRYIIGLCSWCLEQSSKIPWNVMGDKGSEETGFCSDGATLDGPLDSFRMGQDQA
jgi:hypothetical protein